MVARFRKSCWWSSRVCRMTIQGAALWVSSAKFLRSSAIPSPRLSTMRFSRTLLGMSLSRGADDDGWLSNMPTCLASQASTARSSHNAGSPSESDHVPAEVSFQNELKTPDESAMRDVENSYNFEKYTPCKKRVASTACISLAISN